MYPELFSIGPFTIHSFGLMMALGFIAAGITAHCGFRRKGLKTDDVYWLVIAAAAGGLVGSRVHYLLLHLDEVRGDFGSAFGGAGLVWYGGFIGGLVAAGAVIFILKLPVLKVLDVGAPAMAIGYAFGRMGCFLNGDDYGRVSDLPWAMGFPHGAPPTLPGVTVQPTQLYEVAASLLIFLALLWLWPRLERDGELFLAYLVMAGGERFLVEFVRFERPGQLQQQLLALATSVAAAVTLFYVHRRKAGAG